VPGAANPQALNRYSYSLSNPLKYTDPTGHYVCSGQNENWGSQTCYGVINNWLDFLYLNGGAEGQLLVEQFRTLDAEWSVLFEFAGLGGPWGYTNLVEQKIRLDIGIGLEQDYASLGEQSALFGHELVHLLRDDRVNNGTAWSEKSAYDTQAQLLANMGLSPREGSPVALISALEPDDYESVSNSVGAPTKVGLGDYIVDGFGGAIARALVVSYQALSGCYGSTCFVPGGHDARYSPPTSPPRGTGSRRR